MSNSQNSQKSPAKDDPNLAPDALQGTDDTQSEFSVDQTRNEQRESSSNGGGQTASSTPPAKDDKTAVTQSEFSVDERLRGKS